MKAVSKSYSKGFRSKKKGMKKKDTVKEIVNVKKQLRRMENDAELKQHDVIFDQVAITNAGLLDSLNTALSAIAQGDTDTTREGNSIIATSIQWRLNFNSDPLARIPQIVRFLIIRDLRANSGAPQLEQDTNGIFPNNASTNVDSLYYPFNNVTQGRYRILHDEWITLQFASGETYDGDGVGDYTVSTMSRTAHISTGKRKVHFKIEYNNESNDFPVKNSLYAIMIADGYSFGSTETIPVPLVRGVIRLIFKDNN